MKLLQGMKKFVSLQCVFHGIRLLRLILKIDCRETINFFLCQYITGQEERESTSGLPSLFVWNKLFVVFSLRL